MKRFLKIKNGPVVPILDEEEYHKGVEREALLNDMPVQVLCPKQYSEHSYDKHFVVALDEGISGVAVKGLFVIAKYDEEVLAIHSHDMQGTPQRLQYLSDNPV